VAPKSDLAVLLACFFLTVFFDMVIAVSAGIVLAALLFMRRMAEISTARLVDPGEHPHLNNLPTDVLFYEIAGPLFFGAAEKAANTLGRVPVDARAAILHLGLVPVMDITGLVALETAIDRLNARGLHVILADIKPQPGRVIAKSDLREEPGRLNFCKTLDEALRLAQGTPA
jgi:SulP family sulfate permease